MRASGTALALSLVGGVTAVGTARAAGDNMWATGTGQVLAERWCSGCHVTGALTAAPGADVGPPFPLVAGNRAMTALALRVFLQTPHEEMPDIRLTPDEIDLLVAYILSLRD